MMSVVCVYVWTSDQLGLVYIGAKATSLLDGFIENLINVHVVQHQRSTKKSRFNVRFRSV